LPRVYSLFIFLQAISVSTGPIFTIFSPNGRYLREFSRSGPVFSIDVAMATNYVAKLPNPLHWHSEMEGDIATSVCALTA